MPKGVQDRMSRSSRTEDDQAKTFPVHEVYISDSIRLDDCLGRDGVGIGEVDRIRGVVIRQ